MNDAARSANRLALIRAALELDFAPARVEIADHSHLHTGHAGADSGMGHFHVTIISPRFTGLNPVARHRLVYRAMGELMRTEIHALGIDARTPEETGT